MSQFLAVFIDALRLLKAKALFWITLAISVLAAVLYFSIGFNEEGITLFFGVETWENEFIRAGSPLAEMFYLGIFSMVMVNIWLSWVAVILALVTCAPVFPSFMQEGSAGTVLCKPIGRLKLFVFKYLSGLLFAFLQTSIFCLIVFFAIRFRVGTWNPSVFWAVPLIVLMFSYLWSILVTVGVRTKSVMASLLAALLVWGAAWISKVTEEYIYMAAEMGELPTGDGTMRLSDEEQQNFREGYALYSLPYKVLPKTTDTINLLQRYITVEGEREFSMTQLIGAMSGFGSEEDEVTEAALKRHSPVYIIGTSLAFEFVVLGFGAWMFVRRDF
ncbi:hypothetical protein [Haloferula rosea]|uniref:hypothetical protein n=1 Tax=Haloferula rosea TaxID=490093 RepID=UPI0019049CE2|nr:hypothetical protein [Haloferula rosea]